MASWGTPSAQGQPTQECGGRVVPPISRVAHSSWSHLCSLPSGLLGGRKSNSPADSMADAGTRACCLKWGGGSAWTTLAKSTQAPCAASIPPRPKGPCGAGGGGAVVHGSLVAGPSWFRGAHVLVAHLLCETAE